MPGISVSRDGAIADVVLDNPGAKNALTTDMWSQLPGIFRDLDDDDDTLIVLLRGAGDDFSSGADITQLDRTLLAPELPAGGVITPAEEAIARFSKPVIAAIDGSCVGGGWELAAACDLRIASERARLGVTPARLGISYPLSGIARLVALVGPATAKRLLMTAELISAADAAALGMVTEVVPAERLHARARERAERMLCLSQLSIRAAKELVDACARGDGSAELAERRWRREIETAGDYAEGIAAFRASREPEFSWRRPVYAAVEELPSVAR